MLKRALIAVAALALSLAPAFAAGNTFPTIDGSTVTGGVQMCYNSSLGYYVPCASPSNTAAPYILAANDNASGPTTPVTGVAQYAYYVLSCTASAWNGASAQIQSLGPVTLPGATIGAEYKDTSGVRRQRVS